MSEKNQAPLGNRGITLGLIVLTAPLASCLQPESPRILHQKTYDVGQYTITETISEFGSNWPDQNYERVYTIDGDIFAQYHNESSTGIDSESPPRMMGNWLVIMSSNRVFFWQPDKEQQIEFSPYVAEGWIEYSSHEQWDGLGLDGAYGYRAIDVQNSDVQISNVQISNDAISTDHPGRWVLTYRCTHSCPTEEYPNRGPETIQFVSDDQGDTFRLMEPDVFEVEQLKTKQSEIEQSKTE